jgi:ATP-dependent DNA helicase RecG
MERRGYGVETILRESEQLSGRRPIYEQIDDLELCLTIFAAAPPDRAAVSAGGRSTV